MWWGIFFFCIVHFSYQHQSHHTRISWPAFIRAQETDSLFHLFGSRAKYSHNTHTPVSTWSVVISNMVYLRTIQALGSTEGGVISNMVCREECHRIRSTGRLCSGVEAKVVDIISGELLSTNEQGELCIRGPSIMLGTISLNLLIYILPIYPIFFITKRRKKSLFLRVLWWYVA
jgi:acyl-CoA synthetase (AMP-forming)/AMP-acid ligase II